MLTYIMYCIFLLLHCCIVVALLLCCSIAVLLLNEFWLVDTRLPNVAKLVSNVFLDGRKCGKFEELIFTSKGHERIPKPWPRDIATSRSRSTHLTTQLVGLSMLKSGLWSVYKVCRFCVGEKTTKFYYWQTSKTRLPAQVSICKKETSISD